MAVLVIVLIIFAFYLGMKVQKAITLVKETRKIKYIEQVVRQILDKDNDVKLVDFERKRKEKPQEETDDYKEYMRFKKLNEMFEKEI